MFKCRVWFLLLACGCVLGSTAFAADGLSFGEVRNIAYGNEAKNVLDIRYPQGVNGFATVVNFHGGGLTGGNRHYAHWPKAMLKSDRVAMVAVSYRLLNEATPEEIIGDAAKASAWVLRNIGEFGGDSNKVFVAGTSAGGYLTAMLALDPKWMAREGFKNSVFAGAIPITGQMTKHFNVRKVGFGDDDAQFLPKIDEWAPLNFARPGELSPICLLTGERGLEWKCRVEENELLAQSLVNTGHDQVEFHETEGDHGGGEVAEARFLRDFVMKRVDADGVARVAPGERIAFFGDSITHGGLYWAYVQLFTALRHPGWNVKCYNVGISGDSAGGGIGRIGWDVMSFKPDRVFVMFGMNDICRDLWATEKPRNENEAKGRVNAVAGYEKNMRKIVDELGRQGVKRVLITPSPYDQYGKDKRPNLPFCNEPGIANCAKKVRSIASEHHLGVVEMFNPITDLFRKRTELKLCGDRVHPNGVGHMMMAACVLEAMGEGPLVAKTEIDANKGIAIKPNGKRATNANVSDVVVTKQGVRFTYAPKALPWPDTPELAQAEDICRFSTRFNREEMSVKGLEKGQYILAFDGEKIGEFSAGEFAAGIDIAKLPTPNRAIANEAYQTMLKLQQLESLRRTIAVTHRNLINRKIDIDDFQAADKWIDEDLARHERNHSPWLSYFRSETMKYREHRAHREELAAQANDFYERINAIRPKVSRVTISKIE